MDDAKDDLEGFLKKVDEIGSLIKDLASEDESKKAEALKRSDEYLEEREAKNSFDTTVINKYEDDPQKGQMGREAVGPKKDLRKGQATVTYTDSSISPEQFLKDIEEDATNRRKQRVEKEKRAITLKESGNNMFKGGDFTAAVTHYSEAIKLTPDNAVLYCNRAQAYGRLSQHELALKDCESAIFLDERCIKAHVHRGKALQNLNRYEEALESFYRAEQLDKKQKTVIEGYIRELERSKVKFEEESQASLTAQQNGKHDVLKQSIENLRKSSSAIDECIDQLRKVTSLIEIEAGIISFRQYGGFKLFRENPTISRVWKFGSNNEAEDKVLKGVLQLLVKVVEGNDNNVIEFCSMFTFTAVVQSLENSRDKECQEYAACLLYRISQVQEGREKLGRSKESDRAVDFLISILTLGERIAHVCLGTINNLALVERFALANGQKLVNDVIPPLLTIVELFKASSGSLTAMESVVTNMLPTFNTLANLAKTASLRAQLATNEQYWKLSTIILEEYSQMGPTNQSKKVVLPVLRLLSNVCTGVEGIEASMLKIKDSLLLLVHWKDVEVNERVAYIFSRFVTSTEKMRNEMTSDKFCDAYIQILETSNQDGKGYTMKCLAVCSTESRKCRLLLCQKEYFDIVIDVLRGKNIHAVGNVALYVATCAQEGEFILKLKGTNIIQELLKVAAKDDIDGEARHNSAIAIAKLVAADSCFRETLRELHGFEILHEVLQNVKS